jgi:hypothetical protein
MMLKCVAVVCLLVGVLISGCISDDNPRLKPDVVKVDLDVMAQVSDDISYWKMELAVDSDLSKALAKVNWTTVKVEIEGADGDDLFPASVPVPLPETRPGTIGVYYISDQQSIEIESGNLIVVTGVDSSFEGCVVRLYEENKLVGESLPISNFPALSLAVKLGDPNIEEKSKNETFWWNVDIPIQNVTPVGRVVNWSEASARILDSDSSSVLLESNLSNTPTPTGQWIEVSDLGNDGEVDIGDDLLLRNLTMAYEGATFQLLVNGSVVGTKRLADHFPTSNVHAFFKFSFGDYVHDNVTYWFMNVSYLSMRSPSISPQWDDIEVSMVSGEPDPDNVLMERTGMEEYEGPTNSSLQVGYLEVDDPDDTMDFNDIILVTGMNLSFSNATFEFWWRNESIGSRMLPHNLNNTDYRNATFSLSTPQIDEVVIGTTTVWYATININKITPKDIRFSWNDLDIEIVGSEGSVLIRKQSIMEDVWGDPRYDEDDSDGVDVETWYIETGIDDKASAGDAFKMTGLAIFYEGGTVNFYVHGHLVGSSMLPPYFP